MKQLRVLSYLVQPQFVVDDGETLEPLSVQPLSFTPAEWPEVVSRVAEGQAQLAAQIAASDTEEPNRAVRRSTAKVNGRAKSTA